MRVSRRLGSPALASRPAFVVFKNVWYMNFADYGSWSMRFDRSDQRSQAKTAFDSSQCWVCVARSCNAYD